MYCKQCGKPVNENQYACLNCGVKVGSGKGYCSTCGAELPENACVCLSCGVAVDNKKTPDKKPIQEDKVVMALLAFFLGEFGVHNFIMGENKKGILRLLLSLLLGGLGWILAIIDFVKLLCGTYVVDPDAYI